VEVDELVYRFGTQPSVGKKLLQLEEEEVLALMPMVVLVDVIVVETEAHIVALWKEVEILQMDHVLVALLFAESAQEVTQVVVQEVQVVAGVVALRLGILLVIKAIMFEELVEEQAGQ